MSVRKQCNRYRTDPYGHDYVDVKKRAKAFYKDGSFFITCSGDLFFAHRPSLPPFQDPSDAIYFTKVNGRWKEGEKSEKIY